MKHKIISYALVLFIGTLFASCLPEGKSIWSYTGAWGTVEYDVKTGENYVRADIGILMSNDVFLEAQSGNRVVLNYSIDLSKYKTVPSGEACYEATVSNYEEISLEQTISVADTVNIDQYGTHPFDDVSLYQIVVPNSDKKQILSVDMQYTGASDNYPVSVLYRYPINKEIIADTIKFEIRCNSGDQKGTRPYFRHRAYDITEYLQGSDKKVIQLSYTVKQGSGTVVHKDNITWINLEEEEK